LKDGDIVEIDIPNGVLAARLSDKELADRRATWTPPKPKVASGYLARYAKMATSADTGAILNWD
jgi:dihydroxy-acid dehydratase